MTDTKLLIGSLSNDLFRIASLTQRGASNASIRFANESKKWAVSLLNANLSPYLHNISKEIANSDTNIDMETAEKYLMYAILFQNYSLHLK